MSTGTRIPLAAAQDAARQLSLMLGHGVMVVGSVRRLKPDVGDIEFTCQHQDAKDDTLCQKLRELSGEGGLFGDQNPQMIEVVSGVKPGFLSAEFNAAIKVAGTTHIIPVQVHRWRPDNRGWIEIMRTGPREFGMAYIRLWQEVWQVPDSVWKARPPATFINASGEAIPLPSEEQAFALVKRPVTPPQNRQAAAERFWHDRDVRI